MTVKELIEKLQTFDLNREVRIVDPELSVERTKFNVSQADIGDEVDYHTVQSPNSIFIHM